MRLVHLGVMLGAAVLSAQATLQPLGLAGVQTPPTAPATPPGVSQGQGRQGGNPPGVPRPRREVLLIERGKIVAALPAKVPATPRRPRKLLIFNGSANHPSVPYADLAMQLMGEKTGAFTTTISGDSSVLQADSLKQYDAVYLNNNVGTQADVFGTPELRQGFLDYVSNGGGLVASHGTSVASPNGKSSASFLVRPARPTANRTKRPSFMSRTPIIRSPGHSAANRSNLSTSSIDSRRHFRARDCASC